MIDRCYIEQSGLRRLRSAVVCSMHLRCIPIHRFTPDAYIFSEFLSLRGRDVVGVITVDLLGARELSLDPSLPRHLYVSAPGSRRGSHRINNLKGFIESPTSEKTLRDA